MRTDIHSPKRIIPTDYEFVGFDYYGPEPHVETDQRLIHAHMQQTGGDYSDHTHGGTCMLCGAAAFYVGVFYHQKTNVYVAVGERCAEKMEFSSGDWSAFRKAARGSIEAHAGKQVAFNQLCSNGLQTAWFMWAADCDDLPVDESRPQLKNYETGEDAGFPLLHDCVTVRDIVSKLVRYGSISEKQEEFLAGLLKRIADYPAMIAARKAEKAAAADCPTGRVTVTGTILKVEERESQFGTVTKMTVKDETGFIVWTTVPRDLVAERGATVKFTVTLTPSDRDPKFGFGKMPKVFMTAEDKAAVKKARKEVEARHKRMQELGCFDYTSTNYNKTLEEAEIDGSKRSSL